MCKRLSVHGGSWRDGSHRKGRGDQQTREVRSSLESLVIDLDCNEDTCNAFLASEHRKIARPINRSEATF